MESPDVFVFTGHGDDSGDTKQLPPGVTLVTFTTCGTAAALDDTFQIFEVMKKYGKDFFSNPADPINRGKIETELKRPIRVYTKGGEYPDLWYFSTGVNSIPSDDKIPSLENYDIFFKSGVYKLPLGPIERNPEWKMPGGLEERLIQEGLVTEDDDFLMYGYVREKPVGRDALAAKYADGITKSYAGAVFPDQETVTKIANGGSDLVPIEVVFKALGPGVYYWPICRGSLRTKTSEQREKILGRRRGSNIGQIEGHLKRVLGLAGGRRGRKTHRKLRRRSTKKSRRH